jgi:prepilin-type N-terminal cleavage/methylation domain-containing protein
MRARRDRAFTLIEAMVVVLIVSILSVLAVVGYRRWITASRMTEAQNLVSNIRSAEEAFKSENGGYLQVSIQYAGAASPTPTLDYPAATPSSFRTTWGAPCPSNICVKSNSWALLGVQPNAPVVYGYAVVASNLATTTPNDILVNNKDTPMTGMKGAPWYVVEADGDPLATGTYTKIFGLSGNNELFINNDTQ